MRINKLYIDGYKNLKELTIDFNNSSLMAFIGDNGSRNKKTSFLIKPNISQQIT